MHSRFTHEHRGDDGHHDHPHGHEARGRAPFGGWHRGFGGGGFGGPFGGPQGRGRGRANRGDVRAAVLALLAERPMHGYEIIQQLDERTNGLWRPSPGSVYPTLQLLEDEDLVSAVDDGGKRRFELTDAGREQVAQASGGPTPWDEVAGGFQPGALRLRDGIRQLVTAVMQVGASGSEAQLEAAEAILADARRHVYALLAAGPDGDPVA